MVEDLVGKLASACKTLRPSKVNARRIDSALRSQSDLTGAATVIAKTSTSSETTHPLLLPTGLAGLHCTLLIQRQFLRESNPAPLLIGFF